MNKWFVMPLAALLLSGCFLVEEPPADDEDDSDKDTDPVSGEMITSLTVEKGTTPNGDFPVAAKVTMRAVAASEYELRLNGELIESGNMPATAIVTGPFSGIETTDNIRLTYLTFAQAGDNIVELKIIKDDESETLSTTVNIGNQCSGENENFFASEVQASFDECRDCHTQVPDNSSFATLKTWDKIQNTSDVYYVAHAPARFDTMPQANGGAYSHSDGKRWSPGSSEHLRVIEMLYRMDSDFSCP